MLYFTLEVFCCLANQNREHIRVMTFSEWKNLIACILCTSIQFKLKLNNLFNFFQCYISNVQSLRVMPGYTDCLQHRQGIRI